MRRDWQAMERESLCGNHLAGINNHRIWFAYNFMGGWKQIYQKCK
jgi:hypothetical protein